MRLPKDFSLLPNYISQDIYKKIGNAIAKEMMDTYRNAIKDFYADYKPRVYRRRHRSYFFVDPSGTKAYTKLIHQKSNGKGFSVEMNITPDNIRVPYQSLTGGFSSGNALNQLVFTNTFVYGQHGGRLPYDIIPEDLRYTSALSKNGWTKLKSTGWTWIPPKMDTPPKELIDKWFDDYIGTNKIDKTVDVIVNNSIEQFMNSYIRQHLK